MIGLKKETVEKVLNFLAGKPFQEVAGLINEIQSQATQSLESDKVRKEEVKKGK